MIELRPVEEAEFQAWLEPTICEYADEKVQAGNWPAEGAQERSRAEFLALLPQGHETPDHSLFSVFDPEVGRSVGLVWLFARKDSPQLDAFIYELIIYAPERGKGYGEAAMRALEETARARGIQTLRLHVFGHNQPARALYEKLGYETTNINMAKRLVP